MWRAVTGANRFVEEKKPWVLAKAKDTAALGATLRALLEVLRACSLMCQPFMPEKAEEMRAQLALPRDFGALSLDEADRSGDAAWTRIGETVVLFPRLEMPVP